MVKRSQSNSRDLNESPPAYQMCLIYADFKHLNVQESKQFRPIGNHSSIMRANALSIMRANAGQGTFD